MALASLTVDLTLGLAKFEGDSGKAAQIVARDFERMSRPAAALQKSIERLAASAGRTNTELLTIRAATLGLSDATIDLIGKIGGSSAAFSSPGRQGVAAMTAVGAAAEGAAAQSNALLTTLVGKLREVDAQAKALKASAVAQNEAKSLTDDGLKVRLAQINEVAEAERKRLMVAYEADKVAKANADAEAARLAKLAEANDRLRASVAKLNYEQSAKAKLNADATAQAEEEAAARRAAAFDRLRQTVAKLNYETEAKARASAAAAAEADEAATRKRMEAFERLRATVAKLNYEQERKAQAEAASKAAAITASNDAYIASLEKTVAAIGKSRSEIVAMELAQRGLTERGAPLVAKLRDLDAATGQLGKRAFASRNQLLTLQYTIGDVAASAASGISPLTILLQQGGQLFDAFAGDKGGIANVFRGLGQLITPFRLAVGGAAAAVGALAYSFVEGAKQSRAFNDAIVLSGNYAGITEGQFNALAKSVAASGEVNIASAREFTQALIATGEIGPQVLGKAADAAARYGQATGKSAKDVATEFASLNQDVTAGATKLNQSLNFLTAAQLQQIRTLQDQGKSADALGLVYDQLNARLSNLEPNLGTIDRVLRGVTNTWKSFWDAAFDIGRSETIDDKLRKAQERLAVARAQAAAPPPVDIGGQYARAANDRVAAAAAEERDILRAKERQDGAAAALAATAALDKRAAAADEYVRGFERRAKAVSGLNRELAEAKRRFADQDARAASDPNYKPSSAATRAAILAKIREDYTDKSAANEAEQVLKKQRDQALKDVEDSLRQERAAYAFQNQYLTGIYQQSLVSLDDYYADRKAAADANEQAQRDAFARQIAILEAYRKATTDPSERVDAQTRINETRAAAAEAELERQRRVVLLDQERAAALKALGDRVAEYRAQLLALQGDEEGAARIRTELAIANARLFATQAGGRVSDEEIQRQDRLLRIADAFNEVLRRNTQLTNAAASAERAYLFLAMQRGDSLRESEAAVYAIRARAIPQLAEQARRARELADANQGNIEYQQRAADLAQQYAEALYAVDPALNRLRESARSAAEAISDEIAGAINEFKGFRPLIDAIGKDLLRIGTDLIITQPLKVGLSGLFRGISEGDNPVGNLLRSVAGVQENGAALAAAQSAQTVAVAASTNALIALTSAASAASAALSVQGAPAGGLGFLSALFPGGGIAGNDIALAFHTGGIVGQAGAPRAVHAGAFMGARRYHGGGIAGLAPGEVPAVLMGGPRGQREEVLRASDPRHSDNGGGRMGMNVTNYFTIHGPIDRRSQEQIAAAASRGLRSAAARY